MQLRALYALTGVSGAFKVYFLALLPLLYGLHVIELSAVGYLGTVFIVSLMLAAASVTLFFHSWRSSNLLVLAACFGVVASILLYVGLNTKELEIFFFTYAVMGFSTGLVTSAANAIAGATSKAGSRFMRFAGLAMMSDVVRILLPLLMIAIVSSQNPTFFPLFVAALSISALVLSFFFARITSAEEHTSGDLRILFSPSFLKVAVVEFLDSVGSAPLFVFLPLVFLAKGYSLGDSVVFQSLIFLGYLIGRWVIGRVASVVSGWRAVAIAEFGMVLSIIGVLLIREYTVLLALVVVLGVFARGTSPVIKALAFDTMPKQSMKQGSATHVIVGDAGSASGQFLFGLLVATFPVSAAFIVAAAIVFFVALFCLFQTKLAVVT